MEIQRITASEYEKLFPTPYHIFNSVAFSELNKDKCEDLHYLIFKSSKIKLGIILGERDGLLLSPFSAPYGGFSFNRHVDVDSYDEAVVELKKYVQLIGRTVKIALPPCFYSDSHITKSFSALIRGGGKVLFTDINDHYPISNFANFEEHLQRNAKKNFHNSQNQGFHFEKLDASNEKDIARAYSVIKQNRESRGFPLHMSLKAVCDTAKIIHADFFVMSYEGIDVASAQVFHVAKDICQVIYWGDIPDYSHLRVMNYFTYKVFEYYFKLGIKILDIGISTEFGEPNYGLCEFKESIGCEASLKFTLEL